MCRMMFGAPYEYGFDPLWLEEMFTHLEQKQGGDGNGIAILSPGRVKLIKGVKRTPRELADIVCEKGDPFIFHTRKSSCGPVCDRLCQPFVVKNQTVLAHNGTWQGWRDALPILLNSGKIDHIPMQISDSLVAAWMTHSFGPGYLANIVQSGVWLWATVKPEVKVMVLVNNGDFAFFDDFNFASEFPHGTDNKELQNNTIMQIYPRVALIRGGVCATKKYHPAMGYTSHQGGGGVKRYVQDPKTGHLSPKH